MLIHSAAIAARTSMMIRPPAFTYPIAASPERIGVFDDLGHASGQSRRAKAVLCILGGIGATHEIELDFRPIRPGQRPTNHDSLRGEPTCGCLLRRLSGSGE